MPWLLVSPQPDLTPVSAPSHVISSPLINCSGQQRERDKGLSFDLDFTLLGSFVASMLRGLSNFGPRLTVGNSLQNNPRYVCPPAFVYSVHVTVAHINIYVCGEGRNSALLGSLS